MNILVTGANGQLGTSIRNIVSDSADNYIFTDVAELDITDRDSVRKFAEDEKVDMIINCAAYTNVERAEEDEETAERINADAVRILADVMKDRGGFLIHVSTDYVFGGNPGNTPRDEEQPANPTGAYGRTKLHGEEAIVESGADAIILRTAWLYSPYGKNFLKTMLKLTEDLPQLKVVFDQVGTPTLAADLASAIVGIVNSGKYRGNEGIYHFSDEGVCSWYDFTCAIADLAGHDTCRVIPCHSDEFPSKVVRPSYSVLDKTKIKNTFGIEIPHWHTALKDCMNEMGVLK